MGHTGYVLVLPGHVSMAQWFAPSLLMVMQRARASLSASSLSEGVQQGQQHWLKSCQCLSLLISPPMYHKQFQLMFFFWTQQSKQGGQGFPHRRVRRPQRPAWNVLVFGEKLVSIGNRSRYALFSCSVFGGGRGSWVIFMLQIGSLSTILRALSKSASNHDLPTSGTK